MGRPSAKPFSFFSSTLPPHLTWKTRLSIFLLSTLARAARRSDGSFNGRLFSMFDIQIPANDKPKHGVRAIDITVDPSRNLWTRVFIPSPQPHRHIPVLVFFHGGGFSFCTPASWPYDAVCRRMACELPTVVVSVNYRLAPESRCPAAYEDGLDILRFLDNDAMVSTIADLSHCFLVGDSAGGNIVHHVARRWAAAKDWKRVQTVGVVAIQPFFGGEERTESELRFAGDTMASMDITDWHWKAFLPEGSDRDHAAANVFGPRDTIELEEKFPPVLVVVGGYDPLQDWQRRYYEGLKARGKEVRLLDYPDAVHAFYFHPELKESSELMEEMRRFMETNRTKE